MWSKLIVGLSVLLSLILVYSPSITAKQGVETRDSSLLFQTSLLTHHWAENPEHNEEQELIAVEYNTPYLFVLGLAHFKNSYYRPCWYFYLGRAYNLIEVAEFRFYAKLTQGIITGYQQEDGPAIWHRLETFPALLPSLGLEYKWGSVEVSLLADAGFIVHTGVRF